MRSLAEPTVPSPVVRAGRALAAPGVGVDLALAVVAALLATLIRWPYLWLVPRFTDETLEVQASLAIVRDGARPLTNYDTYYGALYNYLVAGALALSSESPLAPRVVVLVAGVLTVAATYGLGRTLGLRLLNGAWDGPDLLAARCGGLVAALLLTVNGPHVVVNSHVAWSNCLTPLFTTAAFWALLRGCPLPRPLPGCDGRGKSGDEAPPLPRGGGGGRGEGVSSLPAAGLLLGLALQTHPLVMALLPGLALGVVWRRWRLLRTPWPWLALVCFLIGYGNMLAFNAESGFESIRTAQRMRVEYGQDEQASAGYLGAAGSMLLLLARIVGGAVDQRDNVAAYLLDPGVLVAGALAVAGLIVAARRGEVLPLAAVLSFLLILPAANPKFTTLITSRYLMPIMPLLFACAGLALVLGTRWLTNWRPDWQSYARVGGIGVVALLAIVALLSLGRYYDRTLGRSDTNERILRLTSEIQAARQPNEVVLIDEGIGTELPDTGVTELRGFEHLLLFAQVPYRTIRPSPGRLQDELDGMPSALVVLNARDAANAVTRVRVEALDARPPVESGRMSDYRLYRITPGRA